MSMALNQTAKQTVKVIDDCPLEDIQAVIEAMNIENTVQPVIFKGACRHWPLVQAGLDSAKSAADYLLSFYQETPVTAYYVAPEHKGRVFYNEQVNGFNYQASQLNLRQVIDKLFAHQDDQLPPSIYMGSTEINHFLPGLAAENSVNIDPIKPLTSVWLGNQSRIAAHFDFPQNLACNVVGKRTFTLFPPEQVANLYIGPMEFAPGGQEISMVDFDNPDFERFPKFTHALAASQTAELEAGDVLYVPSMWWHHVAGNQAFNVLITHWWRDSPGYLGRPNNALALAMLSLRSLPKAQRQAWKAMFEHYVFDHDDDDVAHIPKEAQGMQTKPLDELNARKLRADLINKLKR
ncbi:MULTISPECIES: cupin-like domain-containing protein [unclassified Shewanella]|uniref:cupin-like domain-containing protein n=1 Tax=unclassified Shewanella TaxID=196818 RepID=UPI000C82E485|nr:MULTISPECIES: cupin-like domain-containing protein [unclassified Shewanella]MDO6619585.1 cupin-like domain-containing protein [Shewanella sp. 6_MG-2023]PMG42870.1 cupin [Shewanella sp. 10N.286.52.B9]PMI03462.1 cupin [Shewanella sp. 10N.286.48.A6]